MDTHCLATPPLVFSTPLVVACWLPTARLHPLFSFGKVSFNSYRDALPILGKVTLSCTPIPFLGSWGVGELVSTRCYVLPTVVCALLPLSLLDVVP